MSMKKNLLIPGLLCLAACASQMATAEMYKWTDKNGETHYTQTPPPADTKGKNIEADIRLSTGKLGNTLPPPAPAKENTTAELAKAQEDGKKSEEKHREFCAQQSEALQKMAANSVIRWKDEQGERFLTAEEKASKMAEVQKNLDTLCQPKMFGKPGSQPDKAMDARHQSGDNTKVESGDANASGSSNGNATNNAANPADTGKPAAGSLIPATN